MASETSDGIPISDGFDFPVGPRDTVDVFQTYKIDVVLADEDYFQSLGDWHTGEDWNGVGGADTDLGAPVYAVSSGKVVEFGNYPEWGNIVLIEHALPNGSRVWSQYAHLDRIIVTQVGQIVRRSQQIGTVGKGENNRYPAHLHFEIRKNRLPINNWSPMVNDRDAVLANYHNPTEFVTIRRPGSWPVPGPDPSPKPQPVVPIPGDMLQILVDTQKTFPVSGGFFGTTDVHWNLASGGFKRDFLWVPATAQQHTHWGEWRPRLPSEGQWEVWVYIPPNNATTTYAQYEVMHRDGQSIIPVNQGGNGGKWEILGTFRFGTEQGYVRLTNFTGELSQGSHHMIAFDAVCWTKISY